MPRKKNSTRKKHLKDKVKEANDAINKGVQQSSRILNELESEKKHLQKEITDLNSQYDSTGKTIFKFGKKNKNEYIKKPNKTKRKRIGYNK